MSPTIQVGTVLIDDSPLITSLFGVETEACNWSVIKMLDGFALDRKIHVAGWNFFFMAAEVRVRALLEGRRSRTDIALARSKSQRDAEWARG